MTIGVCLQIRDEAKKLIYQIGIMIVVAYRGAPVQQ
jgi:hypothetical protein